MAQGKSHSGFADRDCVAVYLPQKHRNGRLSTADGHIPKYPEQHLGAVATVESSACWAWMTSCWPRKLVWDQCCWQAGDAGAGSFRVCIPIIRLREWGTKVATPPRFQQCGLISAVDFTTIVVEVPPLWQGIGESRPAAVVTGTATVDWPVATSMALSA